MLATVASATAPTRWTGPELRAQRIKRSIYRAQDIADALTRSGQPISRRRIAAIEAAAAPGERDVSRYFDALHKIESERTA